MLKSKRTECNEETAEELAVYFAGSVDGHFGPMQFAEGIKYLIMKKNTFA